MPIVQNNQQKFRFLIVGGINTGLDFSLFFLCSGLGLSPIFSNYISTTTALSFSFFANKKYTFPNSSNNIRRQIMLFLLVTLFALWVLQPIIIHLVQAAAHKVSIDGWQSLVAAKIAATVVTLIWNYVMYSRYVFKKLVV